jgi:hypothetical protein
MIKPDTPFPKHWLYYIALKYVVIAAAVVIGLYIPAVVSPTSREYLSYGTAEHAKFWQSNGLVGRSPTGGFLGAQPTKMHARRSSWLLWLVAWGLRRCGVLLNHLKRLPVKSACQSSRVKP